jgi:vacuolar protein sorting-associated protein 13A/C
LHFYLAVKFNLSFSVNGNVHTDDKEEYKTADSILNFFLESIGATITEFKDVKFRFALFSINNETKTWKEIYDEIFDHYKIQVLHQAYVLILGLDVLGNPFGLVSDFSQGLTDLFYDPLLGYFSSEDKMEKIEFKMGTKIKSTVNKTISSAAGSGSLITGSIGRVLATCTFDQEYKRVNILDSYPSFVYFLITIFIYI